MSFKKQPCHIVDLPDQLSALAQVLPQCTLVLIDIQRMTTTLTTALGEGALGARIFATIEEVQAAAQYYPPEKRLLGGERNRVLIPGFDRDNSPRSYLNDVAEKTLLFTTTNGAKAAAVAKKAGTLYLGSLLNLSALERILTTDPQPLILLCSGTEGERAEEDELFAGLLLQRLLKAKTHCLEEEDTQTAERLTRTESLQAPTQFQQIFRNTKNARGLVQVGLEADLDFCLLQDRYDFVPVYDPATDLFHR